MELDDHSNTEKPHQVTSWSTASDERDLGHLRSYRCSFCQRGFSNAQALGGHMNIHRKDRARLKEFSRDKSNQLSLEIKKNQSPPPLLQGEVPPQLQESCSDERCTIQKRPCTSPKEIDSETGDAKDDFFGDNLQLSLSIETSSSSNEKDESNSRVARRHVKRSMQLNHGALQTTDLDLELRLGPEPHQTATEG